MSLLLRLPIQGKESAEGLRQLADDTQQHLESLKTLKIDVNEQIIVRLLEEKLRLDFLNVKEICMNQSLVMKTR